MRAKELIAMGVPAGTGLKLAFEAIRTLREKRVKVAEVERRLQAVLDAPAPFVKDEVFGALARYLGGTTRLDLARFHGKEAPAPHRQWGHDLDEGSRRQMRAACKLPVAVRGALMPDAHLGYGLPIGGVLATKNAVIPYAVGVDIACRMKLTVLDLPVEAIEDEEERLTTALEAETRFGIGAEFKGGDRREHPVMDEDWAVTQVTKGVKDKAWKQLGSSGSGNHFVEWGVLTIEKEGLDLGPGRYLALLSHSGSRGAGAAVCGFYSKLAQRLRKELPPELRHLAWLDLDHDAGREYWAAMELMGAYAAANHDCIHRTVREHLGVGALLDIENHHNFAWKEVHDGEEVIVHRKGATPAGAGVLGIIPGSMATPGYVVRGLGEPESLCSAAHGAGRAMSRTEARKRFRWADVRPSLEGANVKLLSAGLDEVPGVYKDIDAVMSAQADLVEALARFEPRLVKMAPEGEKPED